MTKVLALGMAAAMLAGAPLPAMAADAAPADAAVTAETQAADAAVTAESQPADAAVIAETQPEIAMQAADEDAAGTALPNGVDPLTLDGLVQLNDGNWYYMDLETGALFTGWHEISGKWYYFHEEGDGFKGTLMVNCETPDGYTVDVNGALVE